ncbi:MAG: CheR family methyltransferase, partial [Pseudomonadota bacterium]
MTVLSVAPQIAKKNLKILATDLDPNILREAQNGIYAEDSVCRLPKETQRRYFTRLGREHDGQYSVSDELRNLIHFKEMNLTKPWPVKGPFDAVFCRNVVIYFDDPTKEAIWQRFASVIGAGGWLFIGHSERVAGAAAHIFKNDGPTSYQHLG